MDTVGSGQRAAQQNRICGEVDYVCGKRTFIVRLTGFIRFQYENRHRYIPSLVPLPVDDEFTCVFFVQTGYSDGNVQIRAERIGQFLSDVHAAGSASNPASDSCNTISPKQ